MADVFEVLNAADRPCKGGKPRSVALDIPITMAANRPLDAELLELFLEA